MAAIIREGGKWLLKKKRANENALLKHMKVFHQNSNYLKQKKNRKFVTSKNVWNDYTLFLRCNLKKKQNKTNKTNKIKKLNLASSIPPEMFCFFFLFFFSKMFFIDIFSTGTCLILNWIKLQTWLLPSKLINVTSLCVCVWKNNKFCVKDTVGHQNFTHFLFPFVK